MNEPARLCATCCYWERLSSDAGVACEGICRRFPPMGVVGVEPASDQTGTRVAAGIGWAHTRDRDWCGEWRLGDEPGLTDEPALDEEEERRLRNSSAAQALLVLPPEKRDAVLRAVLTEEEMAEAGPPDDFYERIQRYFAEQKGASAE